MTSRNLGALFLTLALQSIGWALPMTVVVEPRSQLDVRLEIPTFIYLDGEIDAATPKRLSHVLSTIPPGAISISFNSSGGNLVAGMELGRIIRRYGASTSIGVRDPKSSLLQPGQCFSACSLAFLGGSYRHLKKGSKYGVHRVSSVEGPRHCVIHNSPQPEVPCKT